MGTRRLTPPKKDQNEQSSQSQPITPMNSPVEKLMRDLAGSTIKPRPTNAFTRAEFMRATGLTQHTAVRRLRVLVDAGKLVKVLIHDRNEHGLLHRTTAYQTVEDHLADQQKQAQGK